ncbi:hypothetical protein P4S93_13380 [Aneurinibacillus thermoaerophilus]|uniref:hypothetical protein n=1 Tax=Aneurinibacillus thermoaerophilus TaxID=143495 RepID=UPI002E1F1F08|nr:hypothetical protein [Aneurinibacillus thermoaerophilus]MED0761757.1 hypothetical protein [Aneurinibacillus thermoaerophilus]
MHSDGWDLYLFHEGSLFRGYRVFDAHLCCEQNKAGVRFAVWAPRAKQVSVVGDFMAGQVRGT